MTSTSPIHFVRRYFVCFFLFGVHLENPFFASKRSCSSFALYIPRVAHLCIVILYLYLICAIVMRRSTLLLDHFFLIISCIPNIVSILWTKDSANKIESIVRNLNRIEHHLRIFTGVEARFEKLECMFRVKLFGFVFANSLVYSLKLFVRSTTFFASIDIVVSLLMLYKGWAIFLVLILIDYNTFLLFSLNQHLKTLQCNFEQSKLEHNNESWGLVHLHRHIQNVHLKIHQIALMINSQFGWFWLAVLLDKFNVIITSIFAIFVGSMDATFGFMIIREFSKLCILLSTQQIVDKCHTRQSWTIHKRRNFYGIP